LEGEEYLEVSGNTIAQIVESDEVLGKFETIIKRKTNLVVPAGTRHNCSRYFSISGLRENEEKRFAHSRMELN
jgi:hypothetical protein